MKNDLEVYMEEIRGILGDPLGKRYGDGDLSEALRLALSDYDDCFPNKVILTVPLKGSSEEGRLLSIGFLPDWVTSVRRARQKGRSKWYPAWEMPQVSGEYLLKLYDGAIKGEAGSDLELCVTRNHTIKGNDADSVETSVPKRHKTLLCHGAAGYAMLIRSRSVTEVFGKRPEDVKALDAKGLSMVKEYKSRLDEKSLIEFDE